MLGGKGSVMWKTERHRPYPSDDEGGPVLSPGRKKAVCRRQPTQRPPGDREVGSRSPGWRQGRTNPWFMPHACMLPGHVRQDGTCMVSRGRGRWGEKGRKGAKVQVFLHIGCKSRVGLRGVVYLARRAGPRWRPRRFREGCLWLDDLAQYLVFFAGRKGQTARFSGRRKGFHAIKKGLPWCTVMPGWQRRHDVGPWYPLAR